MIRLPGYAAVVDKDEAERLRANAREKDVEANVEVEEDRVVVIGCDEVSRKYLCVFDDGRSAFITMGRVWFDMEDRPDEGLVITRMDREG